MELTMQATQSEKHGELRTLSTDNSGIKGMKRTLGEENEIVPSTKKAKISTDEDGISEKSKPCSSKTLEQNKNGSSLVSLASQPVKNANNQPANLISKSTNRKGCLKPKNKKQSNINQDCPKNDALVQGRMSCLVCQGKYKGTMCYKENYVAMDCEFVGVGPQRISALARCSIVDWDGYVVCDLYVYPEKKITDYRTRWSGIRPYHMNQAISHQHACEIIRGHIKDKFVIGHAVHNDFNVMQIQHSLDYVIDTSKCRVLQHMFGCDNGQPVGLKRLTNKLLGRTIQKRQHCSVEDSRATMDLFKLATCSHDRRYASHSLPFHARNVPGNYGQWNPRKRQDSGSYMADHYWSHCLQDY